MRPAPVRHTACLSPVLTDRKPRNCAIRLLQIQGTYEVKGWPIKVWDGAGLYTSCKWCSEAHKADQQETFVHQAERVVQLPTHRRMHSSHSDVGDSSEILSLNCVWMEYIQISR